MIAILKKLGAIKSVVLDQWPYRRRAQSIPRLREQYRPLLSVLPPLPPFQENRLELHMLCGHRDADMGIWASWNIMRFLSGLAKLYVHSDGTLTEEDESLWEGTIGKGVLVVIDRKESDSRVERTLAPRTAYLCPWRCSNRASAKLVTKLVDVHFFGHTPKLLILDSDVLTFSTPQDVIDALAAPNQGFVWCTDLCDAYSASPEVLHEVTGIHVPRRLNSGFLVAPRLSVEDFLTLDQHVKKLKEDPRIDLNHVWSEQTCYALIASKFPESGAFTRGYAITDGRTSRQQIVRHYVGIPRVRFRYFSEGLARITEQLGMHSS
jgi:hypothetical protein